ncbi:glycosyltransferase family 2 protein [Mycolicibacterium mucogenicum]|uniref:glycosyltransferase family 2 protein n=1 Tax=Mycolicibacterium mucogenicum TaxID=56689 RepID=UPI002269D4D2|nr:glycosyltransferase family 2 protein [Mycolicibacterium mucogenicum]MCX8560349.1 glycosyltransferase family 2 protein [Mycolicibacterium mucogenicum]
MEANPQGTVEQSRGFEEHLARGVSQVRVMSSPPASIIVVAFNSASTLADCMTSIPAEYEVIVVDQQSSDSSVQTALDHRPDAKVIRAGKNRGFGAGCNLGAANAASEILIFLNPDAAFQSSESVKILAESAAQNNVVTGPRILDSSGADRTRARYWSWPVADIVDVFAPNALILGRLLRDIPPDDPVYTEGGEVAFVQGSCMAVSATNFWRAGGFDERFYLYQEEEVLARRLLDLGVKNRLEPTAVITHLVGRSTSQFPEFSAGHYFRSLALSLILFRRKLVALPTIFTLWMVLRLMALVTPLRKRIGWRSERGRSWYRAAAAGLICGARRRMADPPPSSPTRPTTPSR